MGWLKKAFKSVVKIASLGLIDPDAGKDAAKAQKEQLRRTEQANKLNGYNAAENVTTFEDGGGGSTFTGTDTRKKKRSTGGFSSNIGLTI